MKQLFWRLFVFDFPYFLLNYTYIITVAFSHWKIGKFSCVAMYYNNINNCFTQLTTDQEANKTLS